MTVESVTNIADLNASNPALDDPKAEGDDHIRNIKTALLTDLPNVTGPITATHTELNIMDGVTSTTAELNILDGVTTTATELNIVDGDTSATSTTAVGTDSVVYNDNGTMKQVSLTDLKTFFRDGLNTTVLDIGDWNMDTTASVNVAHGVTLSKIRVVNIIIRDDSNGTYYPAPGYGLEIVNIDTTNVTLTRSAGGRFDNAGFDSTGYNRGWVTVQYTD